MEHTSSFESIGMIVFLPFLSLHAEQFHLPFNVLLAVLLLIVHSSFFFYVPPLP